VSLTHMEPGRWIKKLMNLLVLERNIANKKPA
jgi:hypothetical protein